MEFSVPIANVNTLTTWLQTKLKSICEADPIPLSQYVVALVKKKKTEEELKKVCIEQLEVFLQDATKKFVSDLFEALSTQSYIVDKEPTPPVVVEEVTASVKKQPEKSSSLKTSTKNAASSNGASKVDHSKNTSSSRRHHATNLPSKTRPKTSSSSSSRHHQPMATSLSRRRRSTSRSRGRSRSRSRSRGRSRSRSRSRSPSRPYRSHRPSSSSKRLTTKPSSPRRTHPPISGDPTVVHQIETVQRSRSRTRCSDFEEKGFCVRGVLCPFDHGSDPVELDDSGQRCLTGVVPSSAALVLPNQQTTYVPSPISFGPPGFYPPVSLIRPPNDMSIPPPPVNNLIPIIVPPLPGAQTLASTVHQVVKPSAMIQPCSLVSDSSGFGDLRNKLKARRHGNDRGQNRYQPYARPMQVSGEEGCALHVTQIPSHLNTIGHLNSHFQKFGQVVNVKICFKGDPGAALVQFSSAAEANLAFRSPDPILDNRFIRVWVYQGPVESSVQPMPHPPSTVKARLDWSAVGQQQERLSNFVIRKPVLQEDEAEETSQMELAAEVAPQQRTTFIINTGDDDEDEEDEREVRKVVVRSENSPSEEVSSGRRVFAFQSPEEEYMPQKPKEVVKLPDQGSLSTNTREPLAVRYMRQLRTLMDRYESSTDPSERRQLHTAIKQVNACLDKARAAAATAKSTVVTPAAGDGRVTLPKAPLVDKQKEISKEKEKIKSEILDLEMMIYKSTDNDEEKQTLLQQKADLKRRLINLDTVRKPGIPQLPMRSQTRLDRRSRTVYVVGQAHEDLNDMSSMFAICNFKIANFEKALGDDDTSVGVVTFETREHSDMAIRAINVFHGKKLTLTYSNPFPNSLRKEKDSENSEEPLVADSAILSVDD